LEGAKIGKTQEKQGLHILTEHQIFIHSLPFYLLHFACVAISQSDHPHEQIFG